MTTVGSAVTVTSAAINIPPQNELVGHGMRGKPRRNAADGLPGVSSDAYGKDTTTQTVGYVVASRKSSFLASCALLHGRLPVGRACCVLSGGAFAARAFVGRPTRRILPRPMNSKLIGRIGETNLRAPLRVLGVKPRCARPGTSQPEPDSSPRRRGEGIIENFHDQ